MAQEFGMLTFMGKKKTTAAYGKANRTDDVSIQFFVSAELATALNDYLASLPLDQRPKKKGLLVTAVQEYLTSRGAWPPKAPNQ